MADRIAKRDPGNAPSSGTRIKFIYIETKGKKKLQGEKIETPSFIEKNNLKIDYEFYITNQIMRPLLQVFGLNSVLYNIPGFRKGAQRKLKIQLECAQQRFSADKYLKKETDLKNKEIKRLIFAETLNDIKRKKHGHQNIKNFFSIKK